MQRNRFCAICTPLLVVFVLGGALPAAALEEPAGQDWAYRKRLMLEYKARVSPKSEASLRDFPGDGTRAASAVGHGKATLVLSLLKALAGEDAYQRILGARIAGDRSLPWDEIRSRFEKETGQDLGWFFAQWVDRKGLPELRVEGPAIKRSGSKFTVSFDLVQKGEAYTLDVPILVPFVRGGSKAERVRIDTAQKHVVITVDEEPSGLVVDRDYEVPRRLTEEETPPLLENVLNEPKPILVLPEPATDLYADLIAVWKQRGAEERKASGLKEAEIKSSSLVILGAENPAVDRIFGAAAAKAGELHLIARTNPWNAEKVVVIVHAASARAASRAVQTIAEQGECSALTIDAQGVVSRTTENTERGIMLDLRTETTAVDLRALKTLSEVIDQAADKRIVYVGEYHDRFSHHTVQLELIKGLARKDPKLAIGMEMFQRPFQAVLDEYISGAIDERQFLKRSEYFKRWKFDYNLYKPILDYARSAKIPVVALNIRNEITDKVAKSGMDSLTDEEKKDVPLRMDFSDIDYRERIKQAFEQHRAAGERSFDSFYAAQILWDETMAQSIDEYLQKNPGQRMVVVAGIGHLSYGSGIPKRVLRRHAYPSLSLLNDADVERDVADYVLLPPALEGTEAPKLMVVLKEAGNRVSIIDLPKESVSKTAGIKTGDVLVALDDEPLRGVDDVKIALFFKKSGDAVRVKVARRRFLLGEKEMEFTVTLP